jgi:DNA-binding MarR family transcriptional regulator
MATRRTSPSHTMAATSDVAIEDSIARVIAGWRSGRPDLDVEAIAVTARLARLQALLAPKLEAVFSRFGVRGADFAVIATVVRLGDESISQSRLASELGLATGTISLRIDRLERLGLARREPDPEDGRSALVRLAARGRELFEACAPEHLANAGELLSGLMEHEREQLGLLLGKLLSSVEDPGPDDRLALELGLVVDSAPVALERRRAVGLPPLAGVLVRHVDPTGVAAACGIRPGDLLRSADRQPLRTHHDLHVALRHARSGALKLDVVRGVEALQLRLEKPK